MPYICHTFIATGYEPIMSDVRSTISPEGRCVMSKPSKSQLSKAGSTLASNSSSKPQKSSAAATLGKG
jgi:hypothetical protein